MSLPKGKLCLKADFHYLLVMFSTEGRLKNKNGVFRRPLLEI
ncbi:hypothetical protein HMPREF1051_2634 [Neisseria sicca VK64]|uniref:Uncharacterized protein n=1 Tax=Neisseria sicca VK64 TaxID=1095748 RepID=I2NHI5_NEISI|nr:hypothetical protein HMPREF1051_2634 [Neisseria sicca VK64]